MQYSKFIPIVTGAIFIICLFKAFTVDYNTVLDTTIYTAAVTVSGGIFGTANLFYYKKALGENVIKVRISLYKEVTATRLKYNARMLELMDTYGADQYKIDEIENNFVLKNETDSIINAADSDLDMSLNEASTIDQQNY